MKPYYEEDGITIYHGDCREVLPSLELDSVNCCVTSPPYWRQRDYGNVNQVGLEQRPEQYVEAVTEIFKGIRENVRSDGTLWLNLGDKWASGGNGGGGGSFMRERADAWGHVKNSKGWRNPPPGYKDKDLIGIPWMVAFALRDSGWYLRQCNIWAKPNCMPESVRDRSTISHEYVFQLSKSNDYFYNTEGARTPPQPSTETRLKQDIENQLGSLRANGDGKTNGPMKAVGRLKDLPETQANIRVCRDKQRGHSRRHNGFNDRWDAMPIAEQMANGANLRSVWWVAPSQFEEEHFAVMPEQIAKICVLAGCPARGMVLDPFCGAGTTLLVAQANNNPAIGIEIEEKYCEIAAKRLAQKVLPWGPEP